MADETNPTLTCQESWTLFVWAIVCTAVAAPAYLAGMFGVGWPAHIWAHAAIFASMYLGFRAVCVECAAETAQKHGAIVTPPEISRAAFLRTVQDGVLSVALSALGAVTLVNADGPIDFRSEFATPASMPTQRLPTPVQLAKAA